MHFLLLCNVSLNCDNTPKEYNGTSDEYVKFSRAMGLPQQRQRVTVDGLRNIGDIKKQKPVNISNAKTVAKSTESGIIKAERETSPRKNKKGDFSVDWLKIQSDEYSDKFKKLSENRRVCSSIETRAKWSLNNRDGLDTEEIYAVDLTNGDEVAKITDQHYKQGVKRTALFTKKLNEADNKGHNILLLHNHPNGFPPSITDINVLLENKNVSGITVGHNGSIYYYTRPISEIPDYEYNIAMRHFKGFTEVTAIEKTLELLSKKYKFTVKKL